MTIYLDEYESPVGCLSLASDGAHLCGLWLEKQKYFQEKLELRLGVKGEKDGPVERVEGLQAREQSAGIRAARAWLDEYFAGEVPNSLPPIMLHGTQFQEEVWSCIAKIPYGELITYGDIADDLAASRGGNVSARAVGVAVGRNPVSIIVPCHRVVGAGRNLTGYSGGIKRKMQLLELEGIELGSLKIPTRGTAL